VREIQDTLLGSLTHDAHKGLGHSCLLQHSRCLIHYRYFRTVFGSRLSAA
jgi:hypothetical protein